MIIKELPLPFPWYDERIRQHRFRKNCAGQIIDRRSTLITPKNALLPFQFRIANTGNVTVVEWGLFDVCGQTNDLFGNGGNIITEDEFDILTEGGGLVLMENAIEGGDIDFTADDRSKLTIAETAAHTYISYNGDPLENEISCGFYESYIKLSDGRIIWSELINVVEYAKDEMRFLFLRWKNPTNIGSIKYSINNFENHLYLDSFVAHTQPELYEEVEQNGAVEEIPTFQKLTLRFILSEVVPDYLKTALQAMPMHDIIFLKDYHGAWDEKMNRVRVNSSIEGGGCFSFVELTFEKEVEHYDTGCDDDEKPVVYVAYFANQFTFEFDPEISGESQSANGLTVTVQEITDTETFKYNSIFPLEGETMSMNIKLAGVTVLFVEFKSDYLGDLFRWTNSDGVVRDLHFTSGIYNL